MKIQQFIPRPFTINAVRVTEENFDEVLEWCGGSREDADDGRKFIRVDVKRPLGEEQTRAYVGNWVLEAKGGFKVYIDPAFNKNYIRKSRRNDTVIHQTVINNVAPVETKAPDAAPDSPRLPVEESTEDSPRVQV